MSQLPSKIFKLKVEDQIRSQKLNDFILGDESCKIVAKFLNENTHFNSVEIISNNISPDGFEYICQALQNNQQIQSFLVEWNQVGVKPNGLKALQELLQLNNSINYLDLKNNQIDPEGAQIIAEIIEINGSLKYLDLKWNDIGSNGGQHILNALQNNSKIQFLDLNCNKVPEEIQTEIDQLIQRNKQGYTIPKHYPQQQQRSIQQRQTQINNIQQQNQLNQEQYMQQTQQRQNQEEAKIENDKQYVYRMKNEIEKQLEDEKQVREQLEQSLNGLIQETKQKEQTRFNLEKQYNQYQYENEVLKLEIDNIQKDLYEMQQKSDQTYDQLDEQLQQRSNEISQQERDHNYEFNEQLQYNYDCISNTIKEWESRIQDLEDRYYNVRNQRDHIGEQVRQLNESIIKENINYLEEYNKLKNKYQEEQKIRYQDYLRYLEIQLKEQQDMEDQTKRKNKDLQQETEYKDKKTNEKIQELEKEVHKRREQIHDLHKNLSSLNVSTDEYNAKNLYCQGQIYRLEEQKNELQDQYDQVKEHYKEQYDHDVNLFAMEKRTMKMNSEQQHYRICELEKAVRNQQAENSRIKSDYERICNAVQHNVNVAISDRMQVHLEHNYQKQQYQQR